MTLRVLLNNYYILNTATLGTPPLTRKIHNITLGSEKFTRINTLELFVPKKLMGRK